MTPTPVDPAAASGPVDRVAECVALRAEVERLSDREFAVGQALVNEQSRSERAETDRDEARAQLAGAQSTLRAVHDRLERSDWIVARELLRVIDASSRCRHCGALPDPDGDHSCPCPNPDETCPSHPSAAALASPPEPEADEVPRDRYRAERDEDGSLRAAPQPVDQPVPPTEPGEQATCQHGEEQR